MLLFLYRSCVVIVHELRIGHFILAFNASSPNPIKISNNTLYTNLYRFVRQFNNKNVLFPFTQTLTFLRRWGIEKNMIYSVLAFWESATKLFVTLSKKLTIYSWPCTCFIWTHCKLMWSISLYCYMLYSYCSCKRSLWCNLKWDRDSSTGFIAYTTLHLQ